MTHQSSSISSALAADSLSLMMKQERTTYASCNYLSISCHQSRHDHDGMALGSEDNPAIIHNNSDDERINQQQQKRITAVDRTKIVDWCYDIIDRCQFNRETVAVAMNITDRFMSMSMTTLTTPTDIESDTTADGSQDMLQEVFYNPIKYQLVAMTALYISIKINEPSVLGSNTFSALSHGTYSSQEIEEMEQMILKHLDWRLFPPTSLRVAHQVLTLLLPAHQEVMDGEAKGTIESLKEELAFQIENSIRDNYFTNQMPSTVAMAAILNATEKSADKDSEVYEHITKGLGLLLKGFDFDSPLLLVAAKERLYCLTE